MMALEGLRVLDISVSGPGNFATMILGDMGAEVILVGPPASSGARVLAKGKGEGEYRWDRASVVKIIQESVNRNKKSMTLNLKSTEGRNIFYELAKNSDVILDGFRPGVTERLQVDYHTIRKINPRIVYCSMPGYGRDGPYRDLPGHDLNFIGLAGALDMIGEAGGRPAVPMNFLADWNGAVHVAVGILTALVARQKTGQGQFVEVNYLESVLSLAGPFHYDYLNYGGIYKRGETFYNGANPFYDVYQAKDGKYVTIACNEPHFWENLCRLLGREDLIPYQFTQGAKKEEIRRWLKKTFLTKTRDEWFDFLKDKDIPIGKVYSSDEVFTDPHIVSRQMVVEIHDPAKGTVKHVGIPFRLSETPGKIRSLAPTAGQDTEEVLGQIMKYSRKDIARLKEQQVI